MGIGTSSGAYYDSDIHHQAGILSDDNIIDPDTTPDIGTRDQNVKTPSSDTSSKDLVQPAMNLEGASKTPIEDRRDEGYFQGKLGAIWSDLKNKGITWDELKTMLQHPMSPYKSLFPSSIPTSNSMSKELGSDTLDKQLLQNYGKSLSTTSSKMPLGSPTEPAGAFNLVGGTQTPDKGSISKSGDNLPDINDIQPSFMEDLFGSHVKDVNDFYEGVKNAFKLPGDVYGGKIDPLSQQGIERAADLAGLMVHGPAPVAAKMADGTLGSFAGVRSAARTGKLNDLGLATVLEKEGEHPEEILKKTGFFRGIDKQWRYEISDDSAKFDKDWIKTAKMKEQPTDPLEQTPFDPYENNLQKPLPEVLNHPDLYKAYPALKNVKVVSDPTIPHDGFWDKDTNTIVLGKGGNDKSTLLHEIQHAIQEEEGHARGAGFWGEDYYNKQALTNYVRSAGEVEARNTQYRELLTPEERRRFMPWDTHDIRTKYQLPTQGSGIATPEGLIDSFTGKPVGKNLPPSRDMSMLDMTMDDYTHRLMEKQIKPLAVDNSERSYTRHSTDEERRAAIQESKNANKRREREKLAQIRQTRDIPIKEDPVTADIDKLIDQYQLGKISPEDTAKLKQMLINRYK